MKCEVTTQDSCSLEQKQMRVTERKTDYERTASGQNKKNQQAAAQQ